MAMDVDVYFSDFLCIADPEILDWWLLPAIYFDKEEPLTSGYTSPALVCCEDHHRSGSGGDPTSLEETVESDSERGE
ncbi:hypothetical protein Taro_003038 [Colocasia esculenta]|uniref:Uncharacterized protein n=1 Tax=Colocasia esculenta TaxID=4460 RepID=A0A843TMJ0_COLES|nr:hypothetical protein [Colocasia esculenta]